MELKIAKENVFRTPDVSFKNKRPAFSSVKNSAKRPLKSVQNTIYSKNIETEFGSPYSSSLKSEKLQLPVEEIRKEFKSPTRTRLCKPEAKSSDIWDKMEDEFFTDCWCSDHFDDDDVYSLPEEIRLTKNDIGTFATKWCNIIDRADISFSDALDVDENDSSELFDSSILSDFVEDDRKSYLELLEESFEVPLPSLASDEFE